MPLFLPIHFYSLDKYTKQMNRLYILLLPILIWGSGCSNPLTLQPNNPQTVLQSLKYFGGPGKDRAAALTSMGSSGDFALFASLDSLSHDSSQILPTFIRVNSSGQLQQQKVISLERQVKEAASCDFTSIQAKAMDQTGNGNVVMLADMTSETEYLNFSVFSNRILYLKTDADGDVLDMAQIAYDPTSLLAANGDIQINCDADNAVIAGDIIATPEGGAIISASVLVGLRGVYSMVVAKIDAEGNLTDQLFVTDTSGFEGIGYYALDLERLPDGNIAALGHWSNWVGTDESVLAYRSQVWLLDPSLQELNSIVLPRGTVGPDGFSAYINHAMTAHDNGLSLLEIVNGQQNGDRFAGDSLRIWELTSSLDINREIALSLDSMYVYREDRPISVYISKIPNNGYVCTAPSTDEKIVGIRISELGDQAAVEEFGSESGLNEPGPVVLGVNNSIWMTGTIYFQGNDMISLMQVNDWLP